LTGVAAHEVLGVGFAVLCIIHCYNNRHWAKGALKAVRKKEFAPKKTAALIVNVLLAITFFTVIVSGVLVSVVIFAIFNIPYFEIFYTVHSWSARALLILSLTHLFLHIKTIKTFFRNRKKKDKEPIKNQVTDGGGK
ncbi:MAG: DUF4405 domain-containing protein, partial [Clostridiales bacterium]|jgi:cytochrome b subunit of formate dehydrogenase|nr:DUF4405 domain-containing protein [Clostridiales bacterium]